MAPPKPKHPLLVAGQALGFATKTALADAAGIKRDTLVSIIARRHVATKRTKARLARALRCTVADVETMLAPKTPTETRGSVDGGES